MSSCWRRFAPLSLVVVLAAGAAAAQSALAFREAELAVPFGSVNGLLAVSGTQIVFVSPDKPDQSLAIERAAIRSLNRSGDVVTVTTAGRIGEGAGARDTFRFRLTEPAAVVAWYERSPASAPAPVATSGSADPEVLASYQVKHDHRIGSCQGRLILTADRVAFESIDDINDSRQWLLADIKEVKQDGIYKLKVSPFVGDTFNFELVGRGMDSGEFRRLVDRIARARSAR